MLGGQINKLFRPIGVPLSIAGLYLLHHNHSVWFITPTLLYGLILTIGYGVNSRLMKWLQDEQLVRIVIGIYCGMPILLTSALTENWFALLGFPLVVGCSCIRLGKWGTVKLFGKDFDILPVDIFRGLAVSISISCSLI